MRLSFLPVARHISIISIFSAGISTRLGPILALVSIILLALSGRLRLSLGLLLFFLLVLSHGLASIGLGHTELFFFFKTYMASVAYFFAFYIIVRDACSVTELFRVYLWYATAVAVVGLLQTGCWQLGVAACYDFSGVFPYSATVPGGLLGIRASSVLPEPSHVAFSLGPAMAASILQIAMPKNKVLTPAQQVILLSFGIFSQSTTLYVLLALSLVLALFFARQSVVVLFMCMAIGLGGMIVSINPPHFVKPSIWKIEKTFELFSQGPSKTELNTTTYTLYYNGKLALDHALETWGFGGGVGSHRVYFDRNVEASSLPNKVVNKTSAGNLVFRLISELGVFGVGLIIYVLGVGSWRMLKSVDEDRIVLAALVVGVVAFCIRNGSFGHYGLAFYLMGILYGRRERQSSPLRGRGRIDAYFS